MPEKIRTENDKRVNDILLGPLERPTLAFFCRVMPAWVNSDMLTVLGVLGSILVLVSYIIVGRMGNLQGNWYLHLASLGFILNWFGDSLDGSLARYRHEERPNYGYFLDHSIDGFTALCIFIGLGASGLTNLSVSMLTLAMYLMLMNSVSLKTHATGVFEMTSIKIGPTEIRLIAILFNTYVYFFNSPQLQIPSFLGETLSVGTLVVGVLGVLMFLYFIYQTVRTSTQLAREDEEALAQRKAKEAAKALKAQRKAERKAERKLEKKAEKKKAKAA